MQRVELDREDSLSFQAEVAVFMMEEHPMLQSAEAILASLHSFKPKMAKLGQLTGKSNCLLEIAHIV